MSDTVHYIGKLTPTGKTVKQFVVDDEIPDYYDDEEEYFEDKYYRHAVLIDGLVFTAKYEDVNPDLDIMNSTKNDDGSIDFEVRYYNGGCSFTEAIDEAIKA